MSRRFAMAPPGAHLTDVKRLFDGAPEWVVIAEHGRMLATADEDNIDHVIAGLESGIDHETVELTAEHGQICITVPANATLREALDAMDREEADVAVITGTSRRDAGSVLGILTRSQIDAAVRYGG